MNKATSIISALEAGKLPLTQQLNAFIDLLMETVFLADADSLSAQSRVLLTDLREILAAYKGLNLNKNGDNLLQQAVWHLTHGDVTIGTNSNCRPGTKEESKDSGAVRGSLSTLFSMFWRSLSEGNFILHDFASFMIAGMTDAADDADGQAGQANGNLRRGDQEMHDRHRGSVGWEAYQKTCERARSDPQYCAALSTLLDICYKWASSAMDPKSTHLTLEDLLGAVSLKILLDRFSRPQSSVDAIIDKVQPFLAAAGDNSREVRTWVDEYFAHARKSLNDAEYANSEEAGRLQRELHARRRAFLSDDTDMGRTWAELKATTVAFGEAVAADEDLNRVWAAYVQLGKHAKQVLVEVGTELEQPTWFWHDMFTVHSQRVLAFMEDIPIPRTEYVDDNTELVVENVDISSFHINPAHVNIHNTTDAGGTTMNIHLQAVQLTLKDVSFYAKEKHLSAIQPTFTGRAAVTMPPQGIDVDIQVTLIPSAEERAARKAYHRIERVNVHISRDAELKLSDTNHAVVLALSKPVLNACFRKVLGHTLGTQLRLALVWLDGAMWDVGQRAEVFTDAGLGNGAALVSAVASEIWRLAKERSWGWHATGTGVVLEDDGDRNAQFAMGSEPQVLSGEKRGPRSERSKGADSEGAETNVADLRAEGKNSVDKLQQSVDDKSVDEEQLSGWQSRAFDI